jgi:hypothetical protein
MVIKTRGTRQVRGADSVVNSGIFIGRLVCLLCPVHDYIRKTVIVSETQTTNSIPSEPVLIAPARQRLNRVFS